MVTIIKPEPPGAADWVADRFIFLDKHGNVVGEKDPNKLTQLVAKGCTLPRAVAERYGLLASPEPVIEAPAALEPEPQVFVEPEREQEDQEPDAEAESEPEPVKTESQKKHHRKR